MGSEHAEPGTVRPGGRTARVLTAVLRAAGDVLVQRSCVEPRQGALFNAVCVDTTSDTKTASALHHVYDPRIKEWAPCAQRAVDRGELPEATDTHDVVRAVSAPLYYRLLASAHP